MAYPPAPATGAAPAAPVDAAAAQLVASSIAVSKSFLISKTFWANILMAVTAYSGYIPAPYAPYIATGANILLRFLTNQPINFSIPTVTIK